MFTSWLTRRRPIAVLLALVVLGALVMSACGDGRSEESEPLIPQDPGDLDNTEWLLVGTGDSDAVPAATTSTLHVKDGRASGTGPCNRYSIPFDIEGTDLTTGSVQATLIGCPPPIAQAETRFFNALQRADTAVREDELLVLSGPDGTRLVFARVDTASKLAGEWEVVNLAAADRVASVVPGTRPTMHFESDGQLTIASGCNTGSTTWKADDTSLTIEAPRSTKKACAEPGGVMEQEAALFDAVTRVAAAEVAQDTAVLVNDDGNIVMVLSRDDD